MTGSLNSVTTQLWSEENRVVLNYRYGHALNLALVDTLKKINICCDAMDIGFKVSKLIRFSRKRKEILVRIKFDDIDKDCASNGIAHYAQLDGE